MKQQYASSDPRERLDAPWYIDGEAEPAVVEYEHSPDPRPGGPDTFSIGHSQLFTKLDEVVHQRTRLALLCVLQWHGELDFNTLRAILELSDGNLARHITVLRASDLVESAKRLESKRRRTYICITELGCQALSTQLEAMADIVRSYEDRCSALSETKAVV